eukprot:scaffold6249_cov124-Isochrysis_galbana.AAC.10
MSTTRSRTHLSSMRNGEQIAVSERGRAESRQRTLRERHRHRANILNFFTDIRIARARKKKLVRLKKPRLPSALGLSGACGVAA